MQPHYTRGNRGTRFSGNRENITVVKCRVNTADIDHSFHILRMSRQTKVDMQRTAEFNTDRGVAREVVTKKRSLWQCSGYIFLTW